MRFILVVMQVDGRVTDRRAYIAAEVRAAGPAELNFADGGHSLPTKCPPA